MARKKAWKPLPIQLKVLFILIIMGVFSTLFSTGSITQIGYPLLGFYIYGIWGLILLTIINGVGSIVLLYGLWNRLGWTWKYGAAYFAFFILNSLLSLISIPKRIELLSPQFSEVAAMTTPAMYAGIAIGTIFAVVLYVIFLIIIYKNKAYFK